MSKIKFLLLSFVIGLMIATSTFAQDASTPQKAVVVAQVNISSSKIVSQVDNNFNISFSLSNRDGVQTNVKYGIRLLKKEGNSQSVVDEKVYDESLTLAENSNIEKNVLYTAPEFLSGNYIMYIMSFNNKGLPLAIVSLGACVTPQSSHSPTQ